jgi:NAD(P)-dependent dehydrogenase (short-subunit alcohol dehydrogenase family)
MTRQIAWSANTALWHSCRAPRAAVEVPDMVTPERLMQFTFGFAPPLIIEAAIRHRVFDVLDAGARTVDKVCAECGTPALPAAQTPPRFEKVPDIPRYRGSMRATAYMASKLGIVGLTRGMARELAPHGIRVDAVPPGITNTAMPRLGNTEEALAALGRSNPTGRFAEPQRDHPGPSRSTTI